MPLLALLLPVLSTLAGGLLVMRLHHRLPAAMTVAAGILVATALIDLLPEAAEITGTTTAGLAALAGFAAYLGLESLLEGGSHTHAGERRRPRLALVAPAALLLHSAIDGVAIGAGFAASDALGLLVLLAVLAHDFADGLNLVTLALAAGAQARTARLLLLVDAIVVPLGALAGFSLAIEPDLLALLLAGFAGLFLATGAGHLLPEARSAGVRPVWIAAGVAAGGGIVALVRLVAG
jgi:ZIP family zinc transporter